MKRGDRFELEGNALSLLIDNYRAIVNRTSASTQSFELIRWANESCSALNSLEEPLFMLKTEYQHNIEWLVQQTLLSNNSIIIVSNRSYFPFAQRGASS